MDNMLFDRAAGKYEAQQEPSQALLRFLYGSVCGRVVLKAAFSRPWFSRMAAMRYYSRLSALRIGGFVKKYGVDLSDCPDKNFRSFNDFFTRRVVRACCAPPDALIACTDGKLTVYDIEEDLALRIKGSVYTVGELLGSERDAADFAGGKCLIYRLSLTDSHRYVFFDDGEIADTWSIPGLLHSVRPIAEARCRVYARNRRNVTLMDTEHFGRAAQTEVGAMLVGRIESRRTSGTFGRMEEKGNFACGGSTIVLLLKRNAAVIDDDILRMSRQGTETIVKTGEEIGHAEKTSYLH